MWRYICLHILKIAAFISHFFRFEYYWSRYINSLSNINNNYYYTLKSGHKFVKMFSRFSKISRFSRKIYTNVGLALNAPQLDRKLYNVFGTSQFSKGDTTRVNLIPSIAIGVYLLPHFPFYLPPIYHLFY